MSLEAIVWAFKRNNLKPIHKFVLVALAENTNPDGVCWPGIKYIATKTNLSERSVQNALKALSEEGLITSKPQHDENGRQVSNMYFMNLETREGARHAPLPRTRCTGEGAGGASPRVQEVHPNHIYEPVIKNQYVVELFNFWKETFKHPDAKLSNERKRAIKVALKCSGIDECKKAMIGVSKSKWHMGQNDNHRVYDKIEMILRDRSNIEKYMEMNQQKQTTALSSNRCKRCDREASSLTQGLCNPCHDKKMEIEEAQYRKRHPEKYAIQSLAKKMQPTVGPEK